MGALARSAEERTFSASAPNWVLASLVIAFMTNRLVMEQNQILENLSTKLSKYLSPQIFQSIFKGEQNVEISARCRRSRAVCSKKGTHICTSSAKVCG